MKWLSFLLSLYIFSLFAYPCEDVCGAEIQQHAKEQKHDQTRDKHHSNTCHGCSPFCICNCCQVQVLASQPLMPALLAQIPETLHSGIYLVNEDDVDFPVWEPPKQ